jgi:MFS transporter, UMF1 family
VAKILTRARAAWCFYDWGNSAYSTNVNSFILSAYFTEHIAKNDIIGTSQWGYATAIAAFLVAIIAPFFGHYIDRKGRIKSWFLSLNLVTIICTFAWWWVHPGSTHAVILALILCALGNFCFEAAFILYNGMLKTLAPKTHVGRLSAWGFAFGYAGGTICLLLVLALLIKNALHINFLSQPYHGIRAVGPVTAVWFLLFSIPIFLLVKNKTQAKQDLNFKSTMTSTWEQLKSLKSDKNFLLFLLARMFYMDGLNTVFAFAGIYAAGTFGMKAEEIILFAIGSQVFALIGAMIFGRLDDKIGSLNCLRITVTLLSACVLALLLVHSVLLFWIFGMGLSITIGPIQSCSRSYLNRLSSAEEINKNFGLYALSGKITAFIGPWLVAVTTEISKNQRIGIIPTLILIIIGLYLLNKLEKPTSMQ